MALLDDRVCVVVGVGPGMGRDAALRLAAEGAAVVLAARSSDRLESVAAEVRAMGRRALCVRTDATDDASVAALVDATIAEFGRLDVLVNNAFRQPPFETLEEVSMETWNESLAINCTAALRTSKAVLPTMRAQGKGSIVNIATMSIRNNRPNFGAYAAAKSALTSLTRTLANEVGPDGIRVNAVCPGFILGDSVRAYLASTAEQNGITYEEQYDRITVQIPLRFIPDSAQICGTVVFYASDLAIACTGTSLDVNGGQWMTW
jgi:NAD(P)-dependent dehydrogenase (short-subunit alcohol dehydrogenase family)